MAAMRPLLIKMSVFPLEAEPVPSMTVAFFSKTLADCWPTAWKDSVAQARMGSRKCDLFMVSGFGNSWYRICNRPRTVPAVKINNYQSYQFGDHGKILKKGWGKDRRGFTRAKRR
jgi:hypothetical protein